MTDLTDKWKKGELPEGWYWIKGSRAEGIYAYTAEYLNHMYSPKNSDRIIEPVPSYEEWQAKDDVLTALLAEYGKLTKELQDEKEKHMTRLSLRSPADEMVIEKQVWKSTLNRSMVLDAENAKLKELLKRARGLMNCTKDWACTEATEEMITKINQVLGEDK